MVKSGLLSRSWVLIECIFTVVGVSAACFIPTGIFLSAYFLLAPQGFWQKFVVFGVGVWFLGIFQSIGLLLFIIFWASLLKELLKEV